MAIDKQKARKNLRRLEHIKVWQLSILLVLFAFISATFLRLNNVGMIERRQAVYAADSAGDNGRIQERLYDLQRYSAGHMNADSGDVYLSKKYDRDVARITEESRKNSTGQNTAQEAVVEKCRAQFRGTSMAYVNCVKEGLDQLPEAERPQTSLELPKPALYRFSFASPGWTPDYAGFSLLITGVIALLIVTRIVMYIVLKIMVKQQYKSI